MRSWKGVRSVSRIKLLLDVVEDMRSLAVSLPAVANALEQGEAPESVEPVETKTPEPTPPPEPTITLEEVRSFLGRKSREGYTDAVRGLLQQFGATRLSEVDPKHYADLMRAAEDLGNGT